MYKVPVSVSCQILMKLSTYFWKIFKYQISWKSVQWEPSCCMWTDGQTDRHDIVNSPFGNFCKHACKLTKVLCLRAGRSEVRVPARLRKFSSSPKHTDQLWGPPSLLLSECSVFVRGYSARGVTLTTHLKVKLYLLLMYAFMAWKGLHLPCKDCICLRRRVEMGEGVLNLQSPLERLSVCHVYLTSQKNSVLRI
jgi:hypothetical protein